ncbi:MAG: hypothetical protein GOMPHAMPRED_005141 [Gomphillus americanus]|uniref:Protein kinase domain-containing protein n=1 Tax=Gomphillus americanus TaxID=1940652 RepID=A0A8H3ELG7_9LECA|nr:MAG: hypothetical protein GOMPHAMPRED_005141 [Gomphillus americanus]
MALSEPTSPCTSPSEPTEQSRLWQRLNKWLGRDESLNLSHERVDQVKSSLGKKLSRRVMPGLPRPGTFKRQNSEKRERLLQVFPMGNERRTLSLDRRRPRSILPLPPIEPNLAGPHTLDPSQHDQPGEENLSTARALSLPTVQSQIRPMPLCTPPTEPDEQPEHAVSLLHLDEPSADFYEQIDKELEDKWILNLSMHFRDNSPREKFFVTYAETSTKWRRLTVSCDYRGAPPDSLERDLQSLSSQRDKNTRIYDAIRSSLPDIQFFDTVTNLRLETDQEDHLHVHVTEDVNETIQYPLTGAVEHLDYLRVSEQDVVFDSHMSGFVYKVRIDNEAFAGKVCVKKEIPGPDSVEEFLYEINALHALIGTSNVIQFEGLVIDEERGLIKGLLISYANQGPLVDLIYEFKDTGSLSWERKAKWARQMTYGLSAIHEAGFVQGDCTLSNIVVDKYDDALIIDINRRGCPVGWEPPEIHNMVNNGHRISMYIGVKSDLFQLGMSLWALITEEEEPEKQIRPLKFSKFLDMPDDKKYLLEVVRICLSEKPKDRWSAEKLLSLFPQEHSPYSELIGTSQMKTNVVMSAPTSRETVYVDTPADTIEEYPAKHFRHVLHPSGSDNLLGTASTISEEEKRGRTPPHDSFTLNKDSAHSTDMPANSLEPLIISVSPGREPKYYGNIYGLNLNRSDEDISRRVIRKGQRVSSLGSTGKKEDHSVLPSDILHGLEHTDSGLDSRMASEAVSHNMNHYIKGLDHIDSGLADMDIGYIDSNNLARRKIDIKEEEEEDMLELQGQALH